MDPKEIQEYLAQLQFQRSEEMQQVLEDFSHKLRQDGLTEEQVAPLWENAAYQGRARVRSEIEAEQARLLRAAQMQAKIRRDQRRQAQEALVQRQQAQQAPQRRMQDAEAIRKRLEEHRARTGRAFVPPGVQEDRTRGNR